MNPNMPIDKQNQAEDTYPDFVFEINGEKFIGDIKTSSAEDTYSDDEEETLCGNPHNNGDEDDCAECKMIKLNL